ncbi:uncharacterized protein LOC115626475 isoform X2 [Scaptodrosophila lebanonensis]|nr:uncharacterized protein LOC115626475 isoform X2 [Scaptodrosophila lebanonensis]
MPVVYEATASEQRAQQMHQVFLTPMWKFFETLFRHHLALLLPFNLALLVPNCKLLLISSLVLVSNFVMFVCFIGSLSYWLLLSDFPMSLRLLNIVCFGPGFQIWLIFRLLTHVWIRAN